MIDDPDRTIALNYAPDADRAALAALWGLDEALGKLVATTTEPLVGQMRLTWWHERLTALDEGERVAEPVLAALAGEARVSGAAMAAMIDGWEALLDPLPLSVKALEVFARERGARLFALSASVLGAEADSGTGEGWALVDFARRCSDAVTRERALSLARTKLNPAPARPKALRVLARLAIARAKRQDGNVAAPLSRWEMLRAALG